MAYFENFPTILYSLDNKATYKEVRNIMRRVIIREYIKNNGSLYVEYDTQDGDTAEIIADKLYGDSNMHWIVFLMNDIINPYYDMPLSSRRLERYIYDKHRGSALFLKDLASSGITSITKDDYEVMTKDELEHLNIAGNQTSISLPENIDLLIDNQLVNVVDWDRTYRKLVVESEQLEDILLHSKLTAGNNSPIRLSRVYVLGDDQDSAGDSIQELNDASGNSIAMFLDSAADVVVTTAEGKVLNFAAIHHFEDSTGYLWNDPLENSRISGYINSLTGSEQEPAGVVTNERYEQDVNDEKRTIKLLRPEFASLALEEIRTILGQTR